MSATQVPRVAIDRGFSHFFWCRWSQKTRAGTPIRMAKAKMWLIQIQTFKGLVNADVMAASFFRRYALGAEELMGRGREEEADLVRRVTGKGDSFQMFP